MMQSDHTERKKKKRDNNLKDIFSAFVIKKINKKKLLVNGITGNTLIEISVHIIS